MTDLWAERPSSSDYTESTEAGDPSAPHNGSTLGTDPSGQAAQFEGGNAEIRARRYGHTKKKTLQEKLDAIWTSETPGTGGVRFGPISTTPIGVNPVPPQIPDAPVQNRMCGGSYDQTGGVGPAQYTPGIRRSHSVASTLGSLTAAHEDGGKPMVGTYADALWCAQHEPTVPYSGLRRSAAADDATVMPPGPTSFQVA
jgi:hypothetical protein